MKKFLILSVASIAMASLVTASQVKQEYTNKEIWLSQLHATENFVNDIRHCLNDIKTQQEGKACGKRVKDLSQFFIKGKYADFVIEDRVKIINNEVLKAERKKAFGYLSPLSDMLDQSVLCIENSRGTEKDFQRCLIDNGFDFNK